MFINFVDALRRGGIPAGLNEHLLLLEALDADVIASEPEQFYYLARSVFVHDENQIDRFDRVFGALFKGVLSPTEPGAEIPEEWLRKVAELYLTPEQMAEIKALGSWDEIMATLKQRLEEQKERHQGGSKWIGTGGTSPFGHGGYNPEGVRIGGEGGQGRAIKVWEKREFRDLDGDRQLGTRNIKVALRRLRRFAREGAADELGPRRHDRRPRRARAGSTCACAPSGTMPSSCCCFSISAGQWTATSSSARNCFRPPGPSFKHLEHYYFHNCIYEGVWKDNRRRHVERTNTADIIHKYGHDHKLVIVGDAAMSPYEISHPGGSIEHMNEEAGAVWIKRLTTAYPAAAWLNPTSEAYWGHSASTNIVKTLLDDRMYPLTLEGLDDATRELSRKR